MTLITPSKNGVQQSTQNQAAPQPACFGHLGPRQVAHLERTIAEQRRYVEVVSRLVDDADTPTSSVRSSSRREAVSVPEAAGQAIARALDLV